MNCTVVLRSNGVTAAVAFVPLARSVPTAPSMSTTGLTIVIGLMPRVSWIWNLNAPVSSMEALIRPAPSR